MRNLFICPSNTNFMPYLDWYNSNESLNVTKFIIWDRFNNQKKVNNAHIKLFKQKKSGHRRGLFDYLLFTFFCLNDIIRCNYQKICVFTPQMVFFLTPFLLLTKSKFIIDIRDYHFLIRLVPKKVFKKAEFVIISSPNYEQFIIGANKVFLSHNISRNIFNSYCQSENISIIPMNNCLISIERNKFSISCVGAIRDYDANKKFIYCLKDSNFKLLYHGESKVAHELKEYVRVHRIINVEFTGFYDRSIEACFYESTDMINILIPPDSINNINLLPNRLYNAIYHNKPVICYKNTAVSKIVNDFKLGCIIAEQDDINEKLSCYLSDFDFTSFNYGRKKFLEKIRVEQEIFENAIDVFFCQG